MAKQDFSNHVRYYTPHHFIFYPVIFALLVISGVSIYRNPDDRLEWTLFAIVVLLVGWLSYMTRQHYALTLQNRIVRLETRLRYYQLTGKPFDEIERQLSFGQIAALRFAPDDEFLNLVTRAVDEKLSPTDIKKSIRNWKADEERV